MSTSYDSVKNWLLNSGLLITNEKDSNFGAVYSFFNESKKNYGYLYPEITGYSASAFSFLYKIENNEKYLQFSKASSKWLTKLFDKYGAIIQGLDNSNNPRNELAYSFDTAICAKGLMDSYSITNDLNLLEYAKKFVNWLTDAIEDDGTILPFMEMNTKKFIQSDDVWYKQKGCLHIKTAIPFFQLYEITKETPFLNKAKLICENFKQFQQDDGSFLIHDNTKIINLHTQSYALEGLLFAYHFTKNNDYLKSCGKALDWCVSNIENDGSILLWFNFKDKSKAVYPIAQIIRLMILLDKLQNSQKYKNTIDKLHKFMITIQAKSNDVRVNGGFYEEFYKSIFGWKKRLKLNSWGSLFALQALYWYDNYDSIKFETTIGSLY